MVAVIDQSKLLLSILQMWNLERTSSEFDPESVLSIISCGLMAIEKREDGLQAKRTAKCLDRHLYSSSHLALAKALWLLYYILMLREQSLMVSSYLLC